MDASASQELWRHASSNILIINPASPGAFASTGAADLAAAVPGPAADG